MNLNSHASDLHFARLKDFEKVGYAPSIPHICGGDDVKIDICLDCGQVQGKFPIGPVTELGEQG